MDKIDTLSSMQGRTLINEIFKELRYSRQYSAFSTLIQCWKISVHERDLSPYLNRNVSVLHPLGFFRGTGLWMEEILNRFYFSSINSFVYFGASILLLLIGVRRFSNSISDTAIIAALALESCLLFFMFVVMFFTPKDDFSDKDKDNERENAAELLLEIGEIAKDLAGAIIQIERINENFSIIASTQSRTNDALQLIAKSASDAVSPNPEMLETMKLTNEALSQLNHTVNELNKAAEKIKREEIQLAVKQELEKLISSKIE